MPFISALAANRITEMSSVQDIILPPSSSKALTANGHCSYFDDGLQRLTRRSSYEALGSSGTGKRTR
jgi:hypothetical protein